jgi:hypothetical protein
LRYVAKFMKQKVNHLSTHSANTCPKLLDALDFGLFLTVHMFKEKHVSITCICSFGAIKSKKKTARYNLHRIPKNPQANLHLLGNICPDVQNDGVTTENISLASETSQ